MQKQNHIEEVNNEKKHDCPFLGIAVGSNLTVDKFLESPRYLLPADTTKTPVLGQLKGFIEMSPDFDVPLDEMMEYMF